MNIKKIESIIKKEETDYLNTKKDYSKFSKHFSFKPFFERNGIEIVFVSLIGSVFTLPINLYISSILGLSQDLSLRFFFTLFLFLLTVITPLFISYFTNKIINYTKFFKTQTNITFHEEYIKNKIMPYFDQVTISDDVLNILKVELSDDQFINLMMDNSKPSYKDLKEWLHKETKIQNLKDIKRNVVLSSDDIKEYSKNDEYIKINTI